MAMIAMVGKRKEDALLSDSMLNHPEHVTLNSFFFLKFLPVVGIIEIQKSWKYQPLTPSGSDFMASLKNEKLMIKRGGTARYYIFLNKFCLK